MNNTNRPEYFEAPKLVDVATCHWPAGLKFRVMKMDLSNLHSAWHVVNPGGSVLTFNDCADDAWDEARANWVANALNDALGAAATHARAAASEPLSVSERDQFESWMLTQGYGPKPRICSEGSFCAGEYADQYWHRSWMAWQAARKEAKS